MNCIEINDVSFGEKQNCHVFVVLKREGNDVDSVYGAEK